MSEALEFYGKALKAMLGLTINRTVQQIQAAGHRWTYREIPNPKNIVIIGGSYAGTYLAQRLSETLPTGYKAVLVERNTHFNHLFVSPRFGVVPAKEHMAFVPYDGLSTLGPPGIFQHFHDSATGITANQPASLHKADEILGLNAEVKSTVAATWHQGYAFEHEENTVSFQGHNEDPTNRNGEADGVLPSIEELPGQISRGGILTGGYQNSNDALQHLREPALDTSWSCLSLNQSALDNSAGHSQGTRDRPVILEDDESDTPDPESAAVFVLVDTVTNSPSEPSKEPWYDVEDECYVDGDLRPIRPLEPEGLVSAPTLTHCQPYSHHYPPGSSHDQINRHGNDGTTGGALDEPAPHSLLIPVGENSGGPSEEENVSELDGDLLLTFEEQEKSLAPAPCTTRPQPRSAEPSHPQIDQEHDQSGAGNVGVEELRNSSPLRSQDQEEPHEQQEVTVQSMRDGEDDEEPEREPRGEKRRHQDRKEETSSDIHYSEDGNRSYETNNVDIEDDEDPRPVKQRKLPPVPTENALTPPCEHRPKRRLRGPHNPATPSTLQPKIAPVNNDHHHTSRTSRCPSVTVKSALVAEYQEWPFQGLLKRTRIGKETTYNLEFHLPHVREDLHLPIVSEALGMRSNKEPSTEAATSHNTIAHSRVPLATLQSKRKYIPWKSKENKTILKKKGEGCSWKEIYAALPHRTLGAIQVQYSTKLKK